MTSKELVFKTLEFRNNGRAPRQLWSLPWAHENYPNEIKAIIEDYPSDFAGAPGFLSESPVTSGDACKPGTFIDEWGCIFENRQNGYIGEVKEPIIADEDWEDARKVHVPVELLTIDPDKINRWCNENSNWFIFGGCCPRPFEQIQFMRGSEQLYIDLMEKPAGLMQMLDRMHTFYCDLFERWAKTDVDALNIMDDWGAQKSLLISPESWRSIFKPMYKDYIDIAHRYGKKIFMHSDGFTLSIIPDLIDLGLDALNTQIFCIGVDKLAEFKGKLTFWGEIDRQHLLPYGTPEDIRKAVESVHATLWQDGGCIAQCEFGPGGKPDNVRMVYETWDRLTM